MGRPLFLYVGMHQSNEEMSWVWVLLFSWLSSVHQRLYIPLEWAFVNLSLKRKLRYQKVFLHSDLSAAPACLFHRSGSFPCSCFFPSSRLLLHVSWCYASCEGHEKDFWIVSNVVFLDLYAGYVEFLLLEWFLSVKVLCFS